MHNPSIHVRYLSALFALALCHCGADADLNANDGQRLFGQPTERTGLDPQQCSPVLAQRDATWTPPAYEAADAERLRTYRHANPPPELDADPYDLALPASTAPSTVCGVRFDTDGVSYWTQSYDSDLAALADGAAITHAGPCGLCSSLQDLAVYMENPDLTDRMRTCGVEGLTRGEAHNLRCIEDAGFSTPCAQIWLYNTRNTREQCLGVCLAALNAPHHTDDGDLNPCLRCDEDFSGPVFKAWAGRTRRNSGLPSSVCRPSDGVYPVEHRYR